MRFVIMKPPPVPWARMSHGGIYRYLFWGLLLLASPVLAWIGRFPVVIEINRVFFMPLLGNVFMLLNILALLILILEPLIPQPDGSEVELALCLDVAGGWKLKYDKERVVGGPCYSFAAAYVRAAS